EASHVVGLDLRDRPLADVQLVGCQTHRRIRHRPAGVKDAAGDAPAGDAGLAEPRERDGGASVGGTRGGREPPPGGRPPPRAPPRAPPPPPKPDRHPPPRPPP